ncbi:5300_t:CDS:2 [Ambispora leptoticha]|uniref:5300_t:CDS:1 n=1 Tax=Ambispora leptoticha TaxID=144679 RepID=A0A9N8VXW5_9GLOM|nr:5300_t:CDS:2 [Ambispora leptoticha]
MEYCLKDFVPSFPPYPPMEYCLKDFVPSFPPYLPTEYFLSIKRNGGCKSKAPNAFLIFRACITAEMKDLNLQIGDACNISRFASNHWKILPMYQKDAYKKISSELKEIFLYKLPKVQYERFSEKEVELNSTSRDQFRNYHGEEGKLTLITNDQPENVYEKENELNLNSNIWFSL